MPPSRLPSARPLRHSHPIAYGSACGLIRRVNRRTLGFRAAEDRRVCRWAVRVHGGGNGDGSACGLPPDKSEDTDNPSARPLRHSHPIAYGSAFGLIRRVNRWTLGFRAAEDRRVCRLMRDWLWDGTMVGFITGMRRWIAEVASSCVFDDSSYLSFAVRVNSDRFLRAGVSKAE